MMTRLATVITSFIALAGGLSAGSAFAQDGDIDIDVDNAAAAIDDIDRDPERCIRLGGVDETYVVDDQMILFYMRNDDVYQNVLRNKCFGLKREDRFSYKTLGGNLCRTDTVTVLQRFGGGFDAGRTCGLGPFIRISPEEAEFLRYGERPLVSDEPADSTQDEEDAD